MPVYQLRVFTRAVLGSLILTILLASIVNPVWAQKAHRVFVVVPALGVGTDSAFTEACVSALKGERARFGVAESTLPILRFNPSHARHVSYLESLGVAQNDQIQVLLCRRGSDGWPSSLAGIFIGETAVRDAFRQAVGLPPIAEGEPPTPAARSEVTELAAKENLTEIGLLLVYQSADEEQRKRVEAFLTELGLYWTQRYGRVKPAPYPLGHYDISSTETTIAVYRAFPELEEAKKPLICLCLFEGNRPRRVLETFDEIDLPATLVRRISSLRTRHLASTVEWSSGSGTITPTLAAVEFSEHTEDKLAQGNLHALARQLWAEASDGLRGENRVTRRVLLTIAELTKPGRERSAQEEELLFEAFDDLLTEPLILPAGSDLNPLQRQLIEAVTLLLESR